MWLILASATLLARLDLSRIKAVPPPQLLAFWLAVSGSALLVMLQPRRFPAAIAAGRQPA